MRLSIFLLLISMIWISCGNEASKDKAKNEVQKTVKTVPSYPPLPKEIHSKLIDSVDYIDFVFYHTDFSTSIDNRAGIKTVLSTFHPVSPNNSSCNAMGRVFFQIDGENALEADFYYQKGCLQYIFLVKGKPTYANEMNETAKLYFNSILQQARKPELIIK